MSHKGEPVLLRCWKCRKCVANSDCLIKDQDLITSQDGFDLPTDQGTCNIWHLEHDASPGWVKGAIEKVHWTTGKLNCPYCRARLGAFNFVGSTKCSCGRLTAIRLCKSKIDVDIRAIMQCPFLSASASQTQFDKQTRHGIAKQLVNNWSQMFSTMDRNKDAPGMLVEALCLEVPAFDKYCEQSGKKSLSTLNVKKYNSTSKEKKESRRGNMFHRKSNSLDIDIKEQMLPNFYNNMMGTLSVKQRQSEGPHFSSDSASCNNNYSNCHTFDINRSQARFVVSAENSSRVSELLYHRTIPTIPGLQEDNGQSSSLVSIAPAASTPRGDCILSSVDLPTHPAPHRSMAVSQRLNKREINKLKNLRRKQKKREKWFHGQKQTSANLLLLSFQMNIVEENKVFGELIVQSGPYLAAIYCSEFWEISEDTLILWQEGSFRTGDKDLTLKMKVAAGDSTWTCSLYIFSL
ncbi:E3 ubiquitin-protein ligase RNF180 isoform X2 [Pseudophryne corroboree]|uniref:E3 ubiquitin-protein ligase RNF180 isoform X2 n=1 Tax=Pseudophryne corroboree TaxID=495146 RepID=UPI003081EBB4